MDIETKIKEMNKYLSNPPGLAGKTPRLIWTDNVMPADIEGIKKCNTRVEPLPYMTPEDLL